MPTDPIRTWTVQGAWTVQGWRFVPPILVDGGRLRPGERVQVVERDAVVAALWQIEAAIKIGPTLALHEVEQLREAVSGE